MSDYKPTGYLTGEDERAIRVECVTLDGVRLSADEVTEADDVNGWVNVSEKAADGRDVLSHRRGVVRFIWKVDP